MLLTAGAAILALQVLLRGETDIRTWVVGQMAGGVLLVAATVVCWPGLGWGRLGVVVVLATGIALRAVAFAPDAAPPISTDLNRYAWDARVAADGVNPYRHAPDAPELAHLRDPKIWPSISLPSWTTPYPPAAQAAFLAARTALGDGRRATTWLFLAAEAVAVGLLVLLLARIGAPLERVVVLAWHPLAVGEIAANGHVDALTLPLLAGLLLAWPARRFLTSGVLIGLAAAVKFGPLVLVPVLWRTGRRALVAGAAGALALVYLPYLSVGADVLGSAIRLGRNEQFGSLTNAVAPSLGRPVAQAALGLVLLVVLVRVARRPPESAVGLAGACLTVLGGLLVVGPYLQPWYALWLLPMLVVAWSPAWLWVTVTLPLLYLYGIGQTLPAWVAPVIYGPPILLWLAAAWPPRHMSRVRVWRGVRHGAV